MIEVRNASLAYRGRTVLPALSLEIAASALTVIVGPNGAGKSTLLKLMTGEVEPDEGAVLLGGEDIRRLSPATLARRRAVLPQSSSLAFPFTVAEVVRFGLEAGGRASDGRAILSALERVDLADFSGRFYQELSGGEQQRVHLARVLCQIGAPVHAGRPRFLFLDEPVSSLDIRHQLGVLQIARDFARAGGGVVAVLHDLNLASAFADRMIALKGGRIVAEGLPQRVVTTDLMSAVFGVRLPVGTVPADAPFVLPQSAASL